jgi:hypothetical protein
LLLPPQRAVCFLAKFLNQRLTQEEVTVVTRKQKIEYGLLILLALGSAAGWGYIAFNQRQQNDPMGIVRKHFLFYPEYSHGVWREGSCSQTETGGGKCRDVTYTVSVHGCGEVTFDWNIFPADGDNTYSYHGTRPKLDETIYPLYAILSDDSHFIDSPALGRRPPETCQLK